MKDVHFDEKTNTSLVFQEILFVESKILLGDKRNTLLLASIYFFVRKEIRFDMEDSTALLFQEDPSIRKAILLFIKISILFDYFYVTTLYLEPYALFVNFYLFYLYRLTLD